MPRLLLVDDNPSIHKIAETLLAPTTIELVCVESAAEAIKRIEAGEPFEVALVDAAMAGMDGWELVAWLRKHPSTAGIPIALMAGVLDSVDPGRLEQAPIQGFLKKPVELRDLGDRVKRLLETPVPPPSPAPEVPAPSTPLSPFATLPAVKLKDLPEFRSVPANDLLPETRPAEPLPEETSDLLELLEEDLLPQEILDVEATPEPVVVEGPADAESLPLDEEPLDLEELDLDGLKGLNLDAGPEPQAGPEDVSLPESLPTGPLPELLTAEPEAFTVHPEDLPDLGAATDELLSEAPEAAPVGEAPLDFDWVDESESLLVSPVDPQVAQEPAGAKDVPLVPMFVPEPSVEAHAEPTLNLDSVVPAAPAETSPVAPVAIPVSAVAVEGGAQALVEALKADPVALRNLAKALVAELGEETLKEIAWELMPELAERLARH